MTFLVWKLQGIEMTRVYLSLGSNIGDSIGHLNRAIEYIKNNSCIDSVKCSSFYETAPQGYVDQDKFINCAIECYTTFSPRELLFFTQDIEKKLKRVKLFRWGPRIIDVDILLFGDQKIDTENLIIPHPRMYERAFVLLPLAELNNEFNKYAQKITDQEVVLLKRDLGKNEK